MDNEYALAARIGMAFLLLSCVIGFVISAHGYDRIESNMSPETYGENGVTKFPHGVAIHVLQILPILSLLLRKFGVQPSLRQQAIWCISGSHLFLLAFACVQTMAGKARFELDSAVAVGLVSLAIILLAVPVVSITRSLGLRFKQHPHGATE